MSPVGRRVSSPTFVGRSEQLHALRAAFSRAAAGHAGAVFIARDAGARKSLLMEVEGLTKRELDVLRLIAAGRTNPEVGEALYISPKAASVHVARILTKLGVKTRTEAAGVAYRLGLLDVS
jgi:DNA-binding NarL/FixJ family response regulator